MTLAITLIAAITLLAALAIVTRAHTARDLRRAQLQREISMQERAAAAPAGELADAVRALTEAAAALERTADRPGPSRLGDRVGVHTKQPDDQLIFGVVVGDYTDRLVLEDAEYVSAAGASPLPGRQDIAARDIAWIDNHGRVSTHDLTEAAASSAE